MAAAPPWGSGRVRAVPARGWYLSARERREEDGEEEEADGETVPLLPPPPGSVRVRGGGRERPVGAALGAEGSAGSERGRDGAVRAAPGDSTGDTVIPWGGG